MSPLSDDAVLDLGGAAEWRSWLEDHHRSSTGVWLVLPRGSNAGGLDYEEAVCEGLCFGWIDSQAKTAPDGRSLLRFSPRSRNSPWAGTNKARVARLEAEGRMTDAGRALIEHAKAAGTWTILDGPEAGIEPAALTATLDAEPEARAAWDAFPPSARKAALTSIALARRADTKARRIADIVAKAARGERPA